MFEQSSLNAISLKNDIFSALIGDADAIMNATLRNMEKNSLQSGEVTIKIKISTNLAIIPDPDGLHMNRTREIIVPIFQHECSSVFKEKTQRNGILSGQYELIYDEIEGRYALKAYKPEQLNMFEDA